MLRALRSRSAAGYWVLIYEHRQISTRAERGHRFFTRTQTRILNRTHSGCPTCRPIHEKLLCCLPRARRNGRTYSYLTYLNSIAYTHLYQTYLSGESFAGQYIPYIADALLKTSSPSAPLRGIAIGNGWIDGRHQYPAYVDFAVEKGLIKRGTKEFERVDKQLQRCYKQLNATSKDEVNLGDCEGIMNSVTDALVTS